MDQHALAELVADIDSQRLREIILSHQKLNQLVGHPKQFARKHQEEVQDCQNYLHHYEERRWLTKKGKKYLIDFDNEERRKMKQYFNSLDYKKTGSIGIDELEELLFSVGLVDSREEIMALIDSVNEDKTGRIEFTQFLSMIQNDEGQNQEIVSFFKSIIAGKSTPIRKERSELSGYQSKSIAKNHLKNKKMQKRVSLIKESSMSLHDKLQNQQSSSFMQTKHDKRLKDRNQMPEILQKYPHPKGLPFEMVVSHIRRKHMMTALNIGSTHKRMKDTSDTFTSSKGFSENTVEQIAKGQKVMHALQKMYERKLIRQIKQNKRSSECLPTPPIKTDPNPLKISFNLHHKHMV